MNKNIFYSILILSFLVHLFFISHFPLTADELNVFNIYFFHSSDFASFWKYFVQYDTHQPLFHLIWYGLFRPEYSELIFRLPSFIFFVASVLVWKKLFSCKEEQNIIPWILFLFCPFLTIYSGLFLPYSLLVLCSLVNYHFFNKLEHQNTSANVAGFFVSAVFLIFTHYYGALQAILLGAYLVIKYPGKKQKYFILTAVVVLVFLLLATSDFINDFGAVHSYRKAPDLLTLLGDLNLLLGGLYTAVIVLVLLVIKKRASFIKSREMLFIILVLFIAFMKSILISPSFEARYLLILIYPLYFLFRGTQIKFITPILIITCIISLFILEKKFSPSFVIDYRNIKKDEKLTALFITPCPKYYFMEENYICTGIDTQRLLRSFDMALVHSDHLATLKKEAPQIECRPLQKGLYSCTIPIPTSHF